MCEQADVTVLLSTSTEISADVNTQEVMVDVLNDIRRMCEQSEVTISLLTSNQIWMMFIGCVNK